METARQRDARIDDLLRDIEQRDSGVLNELWKLIVARQTGGPEEPILSQQSRNRVTTAPCKRKVSDTTESP